MDFQLKLVYLFIFGNIFALSTAKVFTPDELRQVLLDNGIPEDQVATWLCIAENESHFDTTATNTDTGDHGIFQISQIYWCDQGDKGCRVSCNDLKNDDLTDDIRCIKQIYDEHQRIEGNGFLAWVAYRNHCM